MSRYVSSVITGKYRAIGTVCVSQNTKGKMVDDGRLYDLEKKVYELQSQITAMTKDMDSLEKQLEMADAAIERWRAENEEVMKQKAYQYQRAKKAEDELAALKALSNDEFARAERSDALKAQSAMREGE